MLVSGVDDGYFPLSYKGKKGRSVLVSVTYEDYKIINIDFGLIYVDGDDATSVLNSLEAGDIILLDGVTVGGFNYFDVDKLSRPYIIFFSSRPNISKIYRALEKYFDQERRDKILKVLNNLARISTRKGDVLIYTNLNTVIVKEVLEKYQIFDKIPEPLKTAHEIASSLSKFLHHKKKL